MLGHAVTKMWVIIAGFMKGVAPSIHLERTCADGGWGGGVGGEGGGRCGGFGEDIHTNVCS